MVPLSKVILCSCSADDDDEEEEEEDDFSVDYSDYYYYYYDYYSGGYYSGDYYSGYSYDWYSYDWYSDYYYYDYGNSTSGNSTSNETLTRRKRSEAAVDSPDFEDLMPEGEDAVVSAGSSSAQGQGGFCLFFPTHRRQFANYLFVRFSNQERVSHTEVQQCKLHSGTLCLT